MNEYTRREEVRWILASALVLVACVAASLGLLLTARGPVVADPAAAAEAQAAKKTLEGVSGCTARVSDLRKELAVFRDMAAASGIDKEPVPEPAPTAPVNPWTQPPKPKPPKKPEVAAAAWQAAKPAHDRALSLVECKAAVAGILAPSESAVRGWSALDLTVAVVPPKAGSGAEAQESAARSVYAALDKAPVDEVEQHIGLAVKKAEEDAERATTTSGSALIELPLATGILGRQVAIATGVILSLVALLVSFFSLRATSIRRGVSLVPLRRATRAPERGLQAATILRLAAEPGGGEPGLVLGAALGGLASSAIGRVDADWYVAGVMAGLLLGLMIQVVARSVGGTGSFRARALALSEVEKPAVPMVLVLNTINPGLEGTFLDFFLKLSPQEAADAVEKLAIQAEEQILIAADARAMAGPVN